MCFEYTALRMEKKLEYKCAQCGAVVYKTKSQVKRNKSGNVFCNSSCAAKYNNSHYRTGENNPNWIDGSRRGYSYLRIAFRSYKHKCAMCGMDEECCLQVHHIDGNRRNSSLENLIILCANCHSRVHRGGYNITKEILDNRELVQSG